MKEGQEKAQNSRRIAGHKDKPGREHPDADAAGLKLMWEML